MKVFEYMDIKPKKIKGLPDCLGRRKIRYVYKVKKDGKLMVLAINKMQEKGDDRDFYTYAFNNSPDYILEQDTFAMWLFGNPANFFKLFEEALKEGVIK